MQFAISQEIIRSGQNQAIKKRSPYSFRNARIESRKLNAHSLKKSAFKSKQEKQIKAKRVAKKAPNKPIFNDKRASNAVAVTPATKAVNDVSDDAVINKASLIQNSACSASTAFEFDSNYQNYQECEYESTYLLSNFKTTPAFAERVAGAKEGNKPAAGYFLRSSVVPHTRTNLETVAKPSLFALLAEKPAKIDECSASVAPKHTAVTEQALKRPCQMAWSVKISGLASPQFGQANASDDGIIKKAVLPPLSMKGFRESAFDHVALEVTSLKSAPPAMKTFKPKNHPKAASTSTFLMIREKEFPHLFEDPVVRHQRMSKFFAEQDFNSDCETVERNRDDMLKQLEQTISRYNKNDPAKFVENLKTPPSNADAVPSPMERNATPAGASTPVFSGAAFSMRAEQSVQSAVVYANQHPVEDNQNKKSNIKKLELVIDTSASDGTQMAGNPFLPLDQIMESPKSAMSMSPGASPKADVDSASIAFGVMYCPRQRTQRIDQFNCDTRLLREGHDEIDNTQSFIVEASAADKEDLRLGFVPKATCARPAALQAI